jgi:hypothetical protein
MFLHQVKISILKKHLMKAAYKPDGPYGVFAGNECTVAFAKMDMSGAFLNENGHVALTEAE